jgi:ATP phosphoribosyltransferase
VATSFPQLTKSYFSEHGGDVHLVTVSSSVGVTISLGVADAIADIVQTGSTLAAKKLRITAEIGKFETVLIQNDQVHHGETAERVVRRLEGVINTREWSLLEYTILREKLGMAEGITPGFNSPTVNVLKNDEWWAVEVMVRKRDDIEVMDQLGAIGATAILETQMTNSRL